MKLEFDSHADTCILGSDKLIIQNFDQPVDVTGFDSTLGSQRFDTVSGVVKYQHPVAGKHFHLVKHQVIHIPHHAHHLLCPIECCNAGVIMNVLPKDFATKLTCTPYSAYFRMTKTMVNLLLDLKGVISSLNGS